MGKGSSSHRLGATYRANIQGSISAILDYCVVILTCFALCFCKFKMLAQTTILLYDLFCVLLP